MPHELPATIREPIPRRITVVPTRSAILAILIGLTSLAVGATTSPWLVPPYLAAMGWLLLGPARRSVSGEPSTAGDQALQSTKVQAPTPDSGPTSAPASSPIETTPKPKKVRSRAKVKTKNLVASPQTLATWIQVAPGRFVRVEVAPTIEAPNPAEIEPTEPIAPHDDPPGTEIGDDPATAPEPVVEVVASSAAPLAPSVASVPQPDPIPMPTTWGAELRSLSTIIEPDPTDNHGIDEPPVESRLVATGEPSRPGFGRPSPNRSIRFRLRRDPRPKARRGNGRIGASPRVVLHRA